jgi:hypothetical protein
VCLQQADTASIESCSSSDKLFHHASNSSVYSTSHGGMTRIYLQRHVSVNTFKGIVGPSSRALDADYFGMPAGMRSNPLAARRIDVAFPRHFSPEAPDSPPAFGLDQHPQGLFHGGPLCTSAADAHRFTHQLLVNIDVRAHIQMFSIALRETRSRCDPSGCYLVHDAEMTKSCSIF